MLSFPSFHIIFPAEHSRQPWRLFDISVCVTKAYRHWGTWLKNYNYPKMSPENSLVFFPAVVTEQNGADLKMKFCAPLKNWWSWKLLLLSLPQWFFFFNTLHFKAETPPPAASILAPEMTVFHALQLDFPWISSETFSRSNSFSFYFPVW